MVGTRHSSKIQGREDNSTIEEKQTQNKSKPRRTRSNRESQTTIASTNTVRKGSYISRGKNAEEHGPHQKKDNCNHSNQCIFTRLHRKSSVTKMTGTQASAGEVTGVEAVAEAFSTPKRRKTRSFMKGELSGSKGIDTKLASCDNAQKAAPAVDCKPSGSGSRTSGGFPSDDEDGNRRTRFSCAAPARKLTKADILRLPASTDSRRTGNPCPDFLEEDDFRLFRGDAKGMKFDPSKFTVGIATVDERNKGNVDEVTEYVTDIMQRLFEREVSLLGYASVDVIFHIRQQILTGSAPKSQVSTRPRPYMTRQPSLNANMRSIVIDWLVDAHKTFRLANCTLHRCVNLLDRYLEQQPVEPTILQLVGVTSLLIACKIEEVNPPEVELCVNICDKAYSREEVIAMETSILQSLHHCVAVPTGHPFLVRFLSIARATTLQEEAANYYMERMLQEYVYLSYRPSLVAASSVVLALNNRSIRLHERISGPQPGVVRHDAVVACRYNTEQGTIILFAFSQPKLLLDYTGFEVEAVLDVCSKICEKVGRTQVTKANRELNAVKMKYEQKMAVAKNYDEPRMEDVLHLN